MKTIETTITWYSPEIELPNDGMKVICVSSHDESIFMAEYYENFNEPFFRSLENNKYYPKPKYIKYWAYLPNLEITNE